MSTIDAGNAMMSRPMTSSRSDVAAEIDRGIRETIKGIRLSILAMGVGLANMKIKDLYKDLGCEGPVQGPGLRNHDDVCKEALRRNENGSAEHF